MERIKRTKHEIIEYFKILADAYEKEAYRNDDLAARGKAEAYENAAFHIERNMV